jgi:hypothetical protein
MPARSRWLAVYPLLLGLNLSGSPEKATPPMRPISDAESVLAVYREDWGRASSGRPGIIFAAWPDGFIVWSDDRLMGGPPYRGGHVDPRSVTALLTRFDQDGLFADKSLNVANFGPDSQFTTVFIKSEKKQVEMSSCHELMEESDQLVADHLGAGFLDGRRRLDVLRKARADYLFYRFVWSETRIKLADLILAKSTAIAGEPVMKARKLSWQEPAPTRRVSPDSL